jgi:hypothetical protein
MPTWTEACKCALRENERPLRYVKARYKQGSDTPNCACRARKRLQIRDMKQAALDNLIRPPFLMHTFPVFTVLR